MKTFGIKFMISALFLAIAELGGCLNSPAPTQGGIGDQEIPPWGTVGHQSKIWAEGRTIMKNPVTATMREVFLDLGFYESDRADVVDNDSEQKLWFSSQDYFLYRGSGANPKLEIFRKNEEGAFALEVYVANSAGIDHSLSWRYIIGYDARSNHWVFRCVEIAHDHRWGK